MLLAAITVISAGILTYEILLTRLFSIIHWHHFAYMIISIALLGYGTSGSFLTLTRTFWRPRLRDLRGSLRYNIDGRFQLGRAPTVQRARAHLGP